MPFLTITVSAVDGGSSQATGATLGSAPREVKVDLIAGGNLMPMPPAMNLGSSC